VRECVKSLCVCLCVCVCERETVSERRREKLRDGDMQEGGVSLKEDRGVQLDLM